METNAKKDLIINAFIDEITEYGYTLANTNRVCEKAGVSKGLLFHYFKSKENLFLEIANGALDLLVKYYTDFDIYSIRFVDAIKKYTDDKAQFLYRSPTYFKLFCMIFMDIPEEVRSHLEPRINDIFSIIKTKLGALLMRENLRPNVRISEAVNLIYSILKIISEKYTPLVKSQQYSKELVDNMISDFYSYFRIVLYGILDKECK